MLLNFMTCVTELNQLRLVQAENNNKLTLEHRLTDWSKHPYFNDCFGFLRAKGYESLWDFSKSTFYDVLDLKDCLEKEINHKTHKNTT